MNFNVTFNVQSVRYQYIAVLALRIYELLTHKTEISIIVFNNRVPVFHLHILSDACWWLLFKPKCCTSTSNNMILSKSLLKLTMLSLFLILHITTGCLTLKIVSVNFLKVLISRHAVS